MELLAAERPRGWEVEALRVRVWELAVGVRDCEDPRRRSCRSSEEDVLSSRCKNGPSSSSMLMRSVAAVDGSEGGFGTLGLVLLVSFGSEALYKSKISTSMISSSSPRSWVIRLLADPTTPSSCMPSWFCSRKRRLPLEVRRHAVKDDTQNGQQDIQNTVASYTAAFNNAATFADSLLEVRRSTISNVARHAMYFEAHTYSGGVHRFVDNIIRTTYTTKISSSTTPPRQKLSHLVVVPGLPLTGSKRTRRQPDPGGRGKRGVRTPSGAVQILVTVTQDSGSCVKEYVGDMRNTVRGPKQTPTCPQT